MRESFRVLGLYVRGQFLLSLILTVLYSGAFAVAHVPYWYVVGIMGGITAIIPRIGALIPIGLAAVALNVNAGAAARLLHCDRTVAVDSGARVFLSTAQAHRQAAGFERTASAGGAAAWEFGLRTHRLIARRSGVGDRLGFLASF